jgi:Tfp pilus assembly ATPase PilU
MQTLDQSLLALTRRGLISAEQARARAISKEQFS